MNGPAGSDERPQEGKNGFVYVIHAVGTNRVKVGYSANPEKRLAKLQTASPFFLALIGAYEGTIELERAIHSHLEEQRQVGEWFEIDPTKCWEIVLAEAAADSDQVRIALAHLSMLAQCANVEIKQSHDQIEARQAWLTSFIRTGEGSVSEDDRRLARQINDLLSTQSGILSTQPNAA
jgi:hypothetical protein